jgi:hypothetical protein
MIFHEHRKQRKIEMGKIKEQVCQKAIEAIQKNVYTSFQDSREMVSCDSPKTDIIG